MFYRTVTGLIGLLYAATAAYMLAAPRAWYDATPGVTMTGPFNPHFVADVGFAFLAAGLAYLACAWRPGLRPVALGASGFPVFHALFHLSGLVHGDMGPAWVAIALAVPALLGLALVWPRAGEA